MTFTHLGLFEGIGGFSLAVKELGGKTLAWCEWNSFCQIILKHHFPESEPFSDITKTSFKEYEGKIDLLTGGFPCQPFSLAGNRKGSDDERYLWPEMLRAIQEVKPRYIIAENVYGIVNINRGMVFEQVCIDLESEGYEVQAFIIPACAKNAPHRRDRCWFIAYNNGTRLQKERPEQQTTRVEQYGKLGGDVTNSKRLRPQIGSKTRYISKEKSKTFEKRSEFTIPIEANGCGYTKSEWQNFPTQSPICGGDDGLPTELDGITFSKWRNESIKAYGNAIVPQVAKEIIKQILKITP